MKPKTTPMNASTPTIVMMNVRPANSSEPYSLPTGPQAPYWLSVEMYATTLSTSSSVGSVIENVCII